MSRGYHLCPKVQNLTLYAPLSGEYRIRLDANESYFELNDEIRREIGEITAKTEFFDSGARAVYDADAARTCVQTEKSCDYERGGFKLCTLGIPCV